MPTTAGPRPKDRPPTGGSVSPIHHYSAASIAGGAFCPSGKSGGFPPHYQGKYFFMDFVRGWINVLDPDHPELVETFAAGLTRPVDLAFGPDGAFTSCCAMPGSSIGNFRPGTGSLMRIRPESAGDSLASKSGRPRLGSDDPRRHGLLPGRDARRRRTSTASAGRALPASSTKTGDDWVSYRPGGKRAASIGGCPSAASQQNSFIAAMAMASTRPTTLSRAA